MSEPEIELSGGNTNTSVVKTGDTVRRAVTEASPNIHSLLEYLHNRGFDACPRFLGIDDKGREILNFVPGETEFDETLWRQDGPLVEVARLLRRYHDATLGFVAPDPAKWAFDHSPGRPHEVICHNDFAPYNFVFRAGVPVAILDFDLAGPGPRLWDVAMAAYWMVPLSFHAMDMRPHTEADISNGGRRLTLLCESYGLDCRVGLIETVGQVLAHMCHEAEMNRMLGPETTARLKQDGHIDHWRNEFEAFKNECGRLSDHSP